MVKHHRNIIIGAGFAGLYLASKLKELGKSYYIFEKNDYIGGRALWREFHDTKVTMGAGVIRSHDVHIITLCKKYNLELIKSTSAPSLHPDINVDPRDLPKMTDQIKNTFDMMYEKYLDRLRLMTMDEFLLTCFDAEFNRKFRAACVYNDFFSASVIETMKFYPYEDLLPRVSDIYMIKGGWAELINALSKELRQSRIKLNCDIKQIDFQANMIIDCNDEIYTYDNLYICSDISIKSLKLNLPFELAKTLDSISSVDFIRIYSYHQENHGVKKMIITPGILHKLIPINNNILMIAYADNTRATYLNRALTNASDPIELINDYYTETINKLDVPVTLASDITCKYWRHGIHYYKPHDTELHLSYGNIHLIGEFVSNNQGWVEGAIESVDNFISKIKKN